MSNKLIQKAGDNSQQLQANNMVVQIGIDEKRAREIFNERALQLKEEYSREALAIAHDRISEFENRLISKMEAVEGVLEAFADPSFQLLLVEAQKAAASTERPADYDLLSELLIHRFEQGDNRVSRAGISRAVEIVDEIADDALLGLTIFHSLSHITPTTGHIQEGLEVLNDLYGKLLYRDLPQGVEWLDHLDILNAIRVNNLSNLKKIEKLYSEILHGYIDVGIDKKSDNFSKAIDILRVNKLPEEYLVDHMLNPGFVRINVPKKQAISSLTLLQLEIEHNESKLSRIPISHSQISALELIYSMYETDKNIRQENLNKFIEEWDKQPNLKTLRVWWNNLGVDIRLTSVGKVLAHANAQRCYKNFPPL